MFKQLLYKHYHFDDRNEVSSLLHTINSISTKYKNSTNLNEKQNCFNELRSLRNNDLIKSLHKKATEKYAASFNRIKALVYLNLNSYKEQFIKREIVPDEKWLSTIKNQFIINSDLHDNPFKYDFEKEISKWFKTLWPNFVKEIETKIKNNNIQINNDFTNEYNKIFAQIDSLLNSTNNELKNSKNPIKNIGIKNKLKKLTELKTAVESLKNDFNKPSPAATKLLIFKQFKLLIEKNNKLLNYSQELTSTNHEADNSAVPIAPESPKIEPVENVPPKQHKEKEISETIEETQKQIDDSITEESATPKENRDQAELPDDIFTLTDSNTSQSSISFDMGNPNISHENLTDEDLFERTEKLKNKVESFLSKNEPNQSITNIIFKMLSDSQNKKSKNKQTFMNVLEKLLNSKYTESDIQKVIDEVSKQSKINPNITSQLTEIMNEIKSYKETNGIEINSENNISSNIEQYYNDLKNLSSELKLEQLTYETKIMEIRNKISQKQVELGNATLDNDTQKTAKIREELQNLNIELETKSKIYNEHSNSLNETIEKINQQIANIEKIKQDERIISTTSEMGN